jgi:hypothetical protein
MDARLCVTYQNYQEQSEHIGVQENLKGGSCEDHFYNAREKLATGCFLLRCYIRG